MEESESVPPIFKPLSKENNAKEEVLPLPELSYVAIFNASIEAMNVPLKDYFTLILGNTKNKALETSQQIKDKVQKCGRKLQLFGQLALTSILLVQSPIIYQEAHNNYYKITLTREEESGSETKKIKINFSYVDKKQNYTTPINNTDEITNTEESYLVPDNNLFTVNDRTSLSAPEEIKLEDSVFTNDESFKQYGEYALSGKTLIDDEVIRAIVSEYRSNDKYADEISSAIINCKDHYNINAETAITGFMIQEGSFGKIRGNLSGKFNLGNVHNPKTGKFLNFHSYTEAVDTVFNQLYRYDKVWPSEKEIDSIHDFDTALHAYAPTTENPTEERIQVGKIFIDELRKISEDYTKGNVKKEELGKAIHSLRARIQQQYNTIWI